MQIIILKLINKKLNKKIDSQLKTAKHCKINKKIKKYNIA